MRLKLDALQVLVQRLAVVEEQFGPEGATREERARLMDVSVVTAGRILKRQGVDRSSLKAAFESLGLEWQDSLCEFLTEKKPDQPKTPKQELGGRKPRGRVMWAIAVTALALCIAAVWGWLELFPQARLSLRRAETTRLIEKAWDEYASGRYAESRNDIAKAEALALYNQDGPQLARCKTQEGQLAVEQGQLRQAEELFTDAMALQKQLHNYESVPPLLENIGLAEDREGRLTQAREHFSASLAGYRALDEESGVALLLRDLGSLDAESKNWADANKHLSEAEALAAKQKQPELLTDIHAQQALVLRDQGRFAEARNVLEACLAFWRGRNHPRWVARTTYQLGTVEIASGDTKAGRTLLEQSEGLFRSLGDQPGVRDCEGRLAALPSSDSTGRPSP